MTKATILKMGDDRPRVIASLQRVESGPQPFQARRVLERAIFDGLVREEGDYMVVLVYADLSICPHSFTVGSKPQPQLEIL